MKNNYTYKEFMDKCLSIYNKLQIDKIKKIQNIPKNEIIEKEENQEKNNIIKGNKLSLIDRTEYNILNLYNGQFGLLSKYNEAGIILVIFTACWLYQSETTLPLSIWELPIQDNDLNVYRVPSG
jgi:hypothetical protein